MKAYVLRDIGRFAMEEVPKPVPAAGEVLVAVQAAGICGSDIPRIYKTGTYHYPLIPGHEFSGVVVGVGKHVDPGWMGKRAGVFPLIPCNRCGSCISKKYEMCQSYSYLGSRRDGGFAEYVCVPEWNLVELPGEVSFAQAAMLEPLSVAVHAMRRAKLSEHSRVVICGLGTIGLSILMFLRERGISDILAIGNKDVQKKRALELGVDKDSYCDVRKKMGLVFGENEDGKYGRAIGRPSAEGLEEVGAWLEKKKSEKEMDVFFECTGKNDVMKLAVSHSSSDETIVLVGNPDSDAWIEREVCWKILRNQLTVIGTWNSSFYHDPRDDWHYVLERLVKGSIQPERLVTDAFSLDRLLCGFHMMRDKTKDYIKILCTCPSVP